MSYWNRNGKYEKKLDILHTLIDEKFDWDTKKMPRSHSGGCNYHLERLRKAKNAYYRFFNDGDANPLFKQALNTMNKMGMQKWYYFIGDEAVEEVINWKIENAWKEQTEETV